VLEPADSTNCARREAAGGRGRPQIDSEDDDDRVEGDSEPERVRSGSCEVDDAHEAADVVAASTSSSSVATARRALSATRRCLSYDWRSFLRSSLHCESSACRRQLACCSSDDVLVSVSVFSCARLSCCCSCSRCRCSSCRCDADAPPAPAAAPPNNVGRSANSNGDDMDDTTAPSSAR